MANLEIRIKAMESEREKERKEFTSMHRLVEALSDNVKQMQNSITELDKNCECKGEIESIKYMVNQMLSELPNSDAIMERFQQIDEHLEQCSLLESRVSQLEIPHTSIDEHYHGSETNILESNNIATITNELCDRKRRETNFVIHNLPERNNEDQDAADVMEIIEEIMQKDYTNMLEEDAFTKKPKIYRMGRKESGKRRTVKVHLKSTKLRDSIISNSRRLSNSEKYKPVIVQKDLTMLERNCIKRLVAEKKRRNNVARMMNQEPDWTIYNGILSRKSNDCL